MRIAILHSGDLNSVSRGGVDRYIKSLILFFDNYEITVFGATVVGEHEIGKRYNKEYCGKKYYFIPIIDDKKYPLSVRYMIKEFSWLQKLGEYDCVYAQRTEYSIPFMFSSSKSKLIEMIHGSSKYSEVFWGKKKAFVHMFMEKIALGIARKTFIILNREEFGVPYYKIKYPQYARKIEYGRNPIDLRIYYPRNKERLRQELHIPFDIVIMYSGRIENNPKRVFYFPEILKKVRDRGYDCGFVVVGDGQDRAALVAKVKEYGVDDFFFFTGYIDNPDIIARYNCAADISINISMFEGTCTSNLESIACGTPVVSTDVGDIREAISDGENGIIIPNCENEIVSNAADAIVYAISKGVKMNKAYEKYSGEEVIKSLRTEICMLQE